ncbi:TPA: hypothetical protein ACH3X1_004188 [Trebouxia sp. C0004]
MQSETSFSQSCSLISLRPQHSRRHGPTKGCEKHPTQPDDQTSAFTGQHDAENETLKLPSFALAHAAVDVSLSTSASSAVSASASQHDQQPATSPQSQHKLEQDPQKVVQAVQQNPAETSASHPTVQDAPIVQLLSQLDTVKWDQVAAWAAGDSAQAAALVEQLGPSLAESVTSEPDRDHALLRLEAQVARKKLCLTSQQLDEARHENTALHTQLVEMQASQQSLQATQEATLSKQHSALSNAETKLRSQLQQSQGQAAHLKSQLAAATEAASRSHTAHLAQLQQLTEQHAGLLRQLRADHEAQLEAATEHHKDLLQAHTERLEQQNQADVQQLLAQHASQLHSRAAALTAQLQQQLHTDAEKAASKHAAEVTQTQQLVEKSDALLAAEKQKAAVLKAQLKREGKEAAAQLVDLQGQHQALQKQAHASSKAWEDERRKANKSLREAKAAADSDLLKLKQSLADAEQQRHEAVRQCEAEGHRNAVKLAQAGRSLKAAKQEAAEAQKQAKVAREESGLAQAQLDQTCGQVRGLHEELQALKTRLASHAALQQDAATSSLRSFGEQLDIQAQHSVLLQSVLRTISNVMPATSAQQDRWQQEEEGLQQGVRDLVEPQEVLKQVQSYIQQVQAGQDRWQEEEEEHRQQMGSLRVAQERLEGRLRQQEEAKAIAEGEIARQKGCIGSMRAEASELQCAFHRGLAEAKDAKAAQTNADKVVSACRAELLQLSSSLASEREQASMWEGRAHGLQQQLDQARLDQQLLQQDHSQVVTESSGKGEQLRHLGQQLVTAESVRNELKDANGTLTKQLEQTTARALMAESAAQSLSTQLETQQDESCKNTQLLQALFASLAESSSSGRFISPACPQGAEPCSLNRQLAAGLPDQAKAQLVISHVQAVISSSAAQQQQLCMLTQQLERDSAESAAAKATLQAAAQALPHLEPQPADSSLALSHAAPLETPQTSQADPDELSQLSGLAELADAVASALTGKQQELLEVETQVEQLTQHLRQAEAQVADNGVQAQARGAEAQALQQQLAQAQAELQQVQTEAAAKHSSLKARLKAAAQAAQQAQTQQQDELGQLQSQLQGMSNVKADLQEKLEAVMSEQKQLHANFAQQEQERTQLQQQLTDAQETVEKLQAESAACESELRAHISELVGQNSSLASQLHQLHQQQSTDVLELTSRNSGLLTELSLRQQQHAEALTRCTAEVSSPLQRQLASSKQQLKHAIQRLQTAEQQLSSQKLSVAEAESRALRGEALMKKSEERRAGLECDKRRLQAFVRELKSEASSWEHKCMVAQEAQTAQQAEAARLQKQAAASAATAHTQAQLLEQLQAAETALADSHSSAQKLLRELSESQAARDAKQQEIEGLQTQCDCAEQQLQHLQAVADSVPAELESTRQATGASTVSISGKSINRAPAVGGRLLSQALLVDNDENAQPNSIPQLPDSQDAKSERIRQLHLTLGALIDERDALQDTLSNSASPELARQLEDAQAELCVLRKYAGSQTSGRTSLAELDMLPFHQN